MASTAFEPVLLFTRRLNALGLPYMVTGSVASTLYGEPRLTLDVDVVLVLPRDAITRLAQAFPSEQFYRPPGEVLAVEVARTRRGHFNLVHHETGAKADIYLAGSDPLHTWGLNRARTIDVESDPIRVAPPEYVIVRKLEYYREGGEERHARDIQAMLRISENEIETKEIERLAAERGLLEVWREISAAAR